MIEKSERQNEMLNELSNKGTVDMKTVLDMMVGEILMTCLETNDDISKILHLSSVYENSEFIEDAHSSYLIGKNKHNKTSFRCATQLCTDDEDNETYILYGFIKGHQSEMSMMDFCDFKLTPHTTIFDFADHFKNELNHFIQNKLR